MEDVANVHIFIFTCKFFLNFFDAKLFVYAHKEKAVSESLENHILMLFIMIVLHDDVGSVNKNIMGTPCKM